MLRLGIDFVKQGMILGRDVYDIDGRRILGAGAVLTVSYIEKLRARQVAYLFINDPELHLPEIDDVVQEKVRARSIKVVKASFDNVTKNGVFSLEEEDRSLVLDVIKDVLSNRYAIFHLAHIDRRKDDLMLHSVNVAILSAMTAVSMGYSNPKDLYPIAIGALFHDIGYTLIPKVAVALKDKSGEDDAVIKTHPRYGFELLRRIREFPLLAAHVALQHHEKYDGSGYPRNIVGQEIHKYARIVGLANEYDNLISGRFQQKGLAAHLVYEQIMAAGNRSFDPEILDVFLSRIALYPIGTVVRLTTAQVGVVIAISPRLQHRPIIRVIRNADGESPEEACIVDLAETRNLTTFIDSVLTDYEVAVIFGKQLDFKKAAGWGGDSPAPERGAPG